MKKIEDYLHLYLGCEVLWENEEGTTGGREILDGHLIESHKYHKTTLKPILRPLSSILNTEAFEVYKMYFDQETAPDYSNDTGSIYFNPKQVRVKAEHALRIFDGRDYESGDFMKVCSIVPYLLSKHFDLFGLIPAGLAITSPPEQKTQL
jgi:hypothetical protein